jgi:DNA-binding NarL/FixJ family response regulator
MNEKKIKVMLVDDHVVVRMGLKAIIDLENDLEVVGEAANGEDALKLIRQLKPDVAVVDLMMPKMNGVETTSAISQDFKNTKVLILTSFSDSNEVGRAIATGALGVLAKDSSHADIISAIREVAAGKKSISPEIAAAVSDEENTLQLSPRQIEILHYAAKGLTNADISRVLGIGVDCVKAHMKTAFSRLGASNRSEAVALALRKNLLKL